MKENLREFTASKSALKELLKEVLEREVWHQNETWKLGIRDEQQKLY